MANTSVGYKCPNCGGPLAFAPGSEKVTCPYCDTEFEVAKIEELFAKQEKLAAEAQAAKEAKWDTADAGSEWGEDEAAQMQTFTCSSCGAELVSDGNTMATECCYCGNPTMIPSRFSGMLKPDFVIPFKKTKDEAVAALKEFYKGKRLLPKAFTANNRVEAIQPMYVPFWLFHAQVTATATIINMLGGEIGVSYEMGAFIACAVFIIYTATSGLFGVIYTDVFQFVMLILFVYILIPGASLVKLGGPAAFFRNLAPELATPYVDGTIIGDIITYFVFTLAGAEMWQRAFAAKSQKAAKNGLFLGTVAYGLTIPLVWFMGVVVHQLIGAEKIAMYGTTDAVVPALAIEILPVGLTGLALAGILSVIMSTADSYLIVSVQSCVHDVYKSFKPDVPEKKELILPRVFAVIMPLGALLIALYIKNAYNILMFAWSFYAAAAGLPAFAALYWKKATTAGILSGMVVGFTVCIGWKLAGLPFGLGATVPGAIACAAALAGALGAESDELYRAMFVKL